MATNVKQPHRHLLRPVFVIVLAAILILLLLPLHSVAAAAKGKGRNRSSLGELRQCAMGKDEGNILAEMEVRSGRDGEWGSVVEDEGGEFAGGFASPDSMLRWAIGNSDPEKSREKAADVQKLSADELLKRQTEIKAGPNSLKKLTKVEHWDQPKVRRLQELMDCPSL